MGPSGIHTPLVATHVSMCVYVGLGSTLGFVRAS